MNIAVINLRDLIKYFIFFIIVILIISIVVNTLKENIIEKADAEISEETQESSLLYCLELELSVFSQENEEDKEFSNTSTAEKILSAEILAMDSLEENTELENSQTEETEIASTEVQENETVVEETSDTEELAERVETQVIETNNINASYTDMAGSVKINNQTSYDISELLTTSNYTVTNKDKVVIYHTHTCESYTPSETYSYEMTGTYRTTDLNYTVSRVGDELASYLESYGKTVIHDKTYHDYPAYNGSYGRSLTTLKSILESNSDAEIAIDLHRDAVRKR